MSHIINLSASNGGGGMPPLGINNQTGTSYALILEDKQKLVSLDNSLPISLTVPLNSSVAFAIGTRVFIYQRGAGRVTVKPDTGVTINSANDGGDLKARYSEATLLKTEENVWVLYGDIQGIASLDWTVHSSPPTANTLVGLGYDGTTWTILDQTSNSSVYTATDPTGTWTLQTDPLAHQGEGLDYGSTYWAAVLGTRVMTATDPTGTWTTVTPNPLTPYSMRVIKYNPTLSLWAIAGDRGRLRTATDPTGTWTSRSIGFGSGSSGTRVRGLGAGEDLFIVAGSLGKVSTSSDGITWTLRTSPFGTSCIWGLDSSKTTWVFAGESGKVAYSTDPTTSITLCAHLPASVTSTIYGVAYDNGLWCAGGNNGVIITSPNPSGTWIANTSGTTKHIREIHCAGNHWVAVGSGGLIMTAPRL